MTSPGISGIENDGKLGSDGSVKPPPDGNGKAGRLKLGKLGIVTPRLGSKLGRLGNVGRLGSVKPPPEGNGRAGKAKDGKAGRVTPSITGSAGKVGKLGNEKPPAEGNGKDGKARMGVLTENSKNTSPELFSVPL